MKSRRFFPLIAKIIGLTFVYLIAGKLGLRLAFVHANATSVWPPSGIALAAILLWGYRVLPGVLLGAFLVNSLTDVSIVSAGGIAVGNTLEALCAAYLVNQFANGRHAFDRPQDILKFAILAGLLSTTLSATIGVTSLAVSGSAAWANYRSIWITWWLGDAVGIFIVTPLLLVWGLRSPFRSQRHRILEGLSLVLLFVLIGLALFGGRLPSEFENYPPTYMVMPPLVWAVFRFGRRGAVTGIFLLCVIAIWGTLRGFGPFARAEQNESLLLLQVFMGVMSITSLAMGSIVSARKRAEDSLRFLAQASSVLTSLDYRTALHGLTRLAVSHICDWCTVDIIDEDGQIRRAAAAHGDPKKERLLGKLQQLYSLDSNSPHPLSRVLKDGRFEFLPEITVEVAANLIGDTRNLELLKRLGPRSLIAVPLIAQGRILGAITFAFAGSGRHYRPADLSVVLELVSNASIAVDNARLYSAAQGEIAARKRTEQKQMKMFEELAKKNEEIEDFIYAISHDLKGPLISVQGFLTELKRGLQGKLGGDLEYYLSRIEANVKEFEGFIYGLLQLSRVEKVEAHTEDVDLYRLIESTLKKFEPELKGKEINTKVADDLPHVVATRHKINEVLKNLISNAIHYMDSRADPRIEIGFKEEGHRWVIYIKDNGIGIAEEYHQKIFNAFERLPEAKTLNPKGTGMGLAIVKKIIESMEEKIWLESMPGARTTFYFTLAKDRANTG